MCDVILGVVTCEAYCFADGHFKILAGTDDKQ